MNDNRYLKSIQRHPNKVAVVYKTSATLGIFDQTPIEIFDNGIKRITDKKLTVVTSKIAPINKLTDPNILIDGVSYKINDHYQENIYITVVVLQ